MLAIKFKRTGKKHQAHFRLVVTEKRSKLRGNYVDELGWLNPRTDEDSVNGDKAKHWIKMGAKPTPSVHNLLVRKGIINGPKIPVHSRKKTEAGSEAVKTGA